MFDYGLGQTPPTRAVDMTLQRALRLADDPNAKKILAKLGMRIGQARPEQDRFRAWCDRADLLYYAEDITDGGADLWASDPSANTPGRSHVSINTPAAYVDIPAALQAEDPIENFLATDTTKEARTAAAALERVYTAWKASEHYSLKEHKLIQVKALYGRTAKKVYWDQDEEGGKGRPCVEIVEQPRNLYMGYRRDDYEELEWAAYVTRYDPNYVMDEFGVDVTARDDNGSIVPFIQAETLQALPSRSWLNFGPARIEVWDYWYREPQYNKSGKFTKMMTMNVVLAGNMIVEGPNPYPEYEGEIPYIPVFNTFIPGVPGGRPELYDIEPLIREKFERVTAGSQMIASAVAGDYWQLVGAEAPWRVPASLKPKRNEVVGPGPGNRIETITPFIAQFQLEQYLGRLDREMAIVSGLNDLLLGLAPAQVLSSSKAINALIANYESRLSMRRRLLYQSRRKTWEMALKIWAKKDKTIRQIVANGGGRLDIIDPSLSPRDEQETAIRAANLVNAKLWSQRRGMDAVGVDDPETEQDMIREERTDATLFPQDVQIMAQLMAALKSLGLNTPQGAQQEAQGQLASGQHDLAQALGQATPNGTPGTQGPESQPQLPPEAQQQEIQGGGTPPGAPFAQGPAGQAPLQAPGSAGLLQQTYANGKVTAKIKTQTQLGRR